MVTKSVAVQLIRCEGDGFVINPGVVIVGAGLAGLCCAHRLCQLGVACKILEAADEIGGRVRTDKVDGFLLDRGFQVLLTEYSEAQRVLDFESLQLKEFEPGALIRFNGKFHRLTDPWRRPQYFWATTLSPVASLADKLRIARLRRRVSKLSIAEINRRPETSTINRLRENGFSGRVIESFFRPFLGGIFLERELQTSSRKFEFLFRMFANGDAVLPADGMRAIPRQIAANLPKDTIQTLSPVSSVRSDRVGLADGQVIRANAVVVATDHATASRLLGEPFRGSSNSTICIYFAAKRPPIDEPILILNGDGDSPINNLCVPSQVAPSYSPDDRALVSVTVVGKERTEAQNLITSVRQQLAKWFGHESNQWEHLRTYHIEHALPRQTSLDPVEKPVIRADGVFVCGDYLDAASIQGAMASGRRAAESVMQHVTQSNPLKQN